MDPPVRIAITVEQFWHRVPGGTATSIWALVSALATRAGLDVTAVSAWHKRRAPARFRLPVPIEWIPLPRWAMYEGWHRLRRPRVELATGPVEVVHATTSAIPPRSAPLVVTIHDLAFLHAPENFTPRGVRFFHRGLELARREADIVICPSETTARDCTANGFESERVRVIPWGVDRVLVKDIDLDRVKAEFELDRPYVLWTGTIEPRKNLPRLIEAFLAVDREVDLVLAGPEGWNEDVTALITRSNGRVRPLGYVETDDLHALYAGAALFCYPSLLEGFGLPVLEAMAQGCPVVTSAGTATEEVAGGAALLVDPTDRDGIAAAISRLIDEPETANLHGAAGKARAAELTWDRCADATEAVYREVVS